MQLSDRCALSQSLADKNKQSDASRTIGHHKASTNPKLTGECGHRGGDPSLCLWLGQAATSKGQSDGNHEGSPAFYYHQHFIQKASYVLVYISALNYSPFPLTLISFNRTHLLQLIDADSGKQAARIRDRQKAIWVGKLFFRSLDVQKHL